MIYKVVPQEAMRRLLDYNRRRYWLERPHGIKYSLTLYDVDRTRLLGFDNAHGLPRVQAYDHRHRFPLTAELLPYHYQGADELICDFFAAVEMACRQKGAPFEFEAEDIELELEDGDGTEESS